MKKLLFLILLLTNGSAFSQTTSDNYPIDTTIGVENKMDSSLMAATDTMQNISDITSDAQNESGIGTILLLVMLILAIIVVCVVIYQKNKKELSDIDAHLANAEIALHSNKVITARTELNSAKSFLTKVSDAIRSKKQEELSLLLEKVETKLKKEAAEQLKNVRKEVENGQFIDIETIKKKIQPTITQETPKEIQNAIKSFVDEVEEQYEKGIIPNQTLNYVQYNASKLAIPNKDGYYCYTLFPPQNTILFPYRRKKVERRGYTEESFQHKLSKAISAYSNLIVLGDVSILTKTGTHPYEPDIAIVENNFEKGFRIDIEIDEPYTGYERKPIHYIRCGDNFRDQILINHGWIVVRFSEKQIYEESSKCIAYH